MASRGHTIKVADTVWSAWQECAAQKQTTVTQMLKMAVELAFGPSSQAQEQVDVIEEAIARRNAVPHLSGVGPPVREIKPFPKSTQLGKKK